MRVVTDSTGLRLDGVFSKPQSFQFVNSCVAFSTLDSLGEVSLLYPGKEALTRVTATAMVSRSAAVSTVASIIAGS